MTGNYSIKVFISYRCHKQDIYSLIKISSAYQKSERSIDGENQTDGRANVRGRQRWSALVYQEMGQSSGKWKSKKWILLESPLGIHLQGPSSRDVEVFVVGGNSLNLS